MLQDVAGKRLLRIFPSYSYDIPIKYHDVPLLITIKSPFYKWYLVSTPTSPVAQGGLVLVSCRNPHVSTCFDRPLILVSLFRPFAARLIPIRGQFSVAPNKTKLFNVILYALGIQFSNPLQVS